MLKSKVSNLHPAWITDADHSGINDVTYAELERCPARTWRRRGTSVGLYSLTLLYNNVRIRVSGSIYIAPLQEQTVSAICMMLNVNNG